MLTPQYKIDDATISKLAIEIARNLYPPADIRESFKLTVEEFEEATSTPYFQTRLAEEISLWNSPSNAKTRIKAKAGTMIELAMPEYFALMHDKTQPMAAKVALLQQFARLAEVDNPSIKGNEDTSDRRVKITINIAGQTLSYDKEKAPENAKIIEGEALAIANGN